MKRLTAIIILVCTVLTLVSCDGIKFSGGTRTMFSESNVNGTYKCKWGTMQGTHEAVIRKNTSGESAIYYSASLDEGEFSVYCESSYTDGEALMFTVKGGETVESTFGYVEKGDRIDITIRTNGKTKGGALEIKAD